MKEKLYKIALEIWEDLDTEFLDENTLNYLVDNNILIEKNFTFDNTYTPNSNLSINSYVELITTLSSPHYCSLVLWDNDSIELFVHPTLKNRMDFRKKYQANYRAFSELMKAE